jgi:tRNA/rRNA methyltransferase
VQPATLFMLPSPPVVVLVEPQNPANVGFAARVLDNFGLGEARLLNGCDLQGSEAERTGAPARARLHAMRSVSDWQAATEGCTHLVGFTARAGRTRAPISLDDWGPALDEIGRKAKLGFVFGREDRGLETDEVERCHLLVSIPTAGLESLNLSHAIAVAAYAWRRWAGGSSMPTSPGIESADSKLAGSAIAAQADRMRVAERAAQELEAAAFRDSDERVVATLRRLSSLPIEARDLRIIERALKHARWRRENPAD